MSPRVATAKGNYSPNPSTLLSKMVHGTQSSTSEILNVENSKRVAQLLALTEEIVERAAEQGHADITFGLCPDATFFGRPSLLAFHEGQLGRTLPKAGCHAFIACGRPDRTARKANAMSIDSAAWLKICNHAIIEHFKSLRFTVETFNDIYLTLRWATQEEQIWAAQIASDPSRRKAFECGVPMPDIMA